MQLNYARLTKAGIILWIFLLILPFKVSLQKSSEHPAWSLQISEAKATPIPKDLTSPKNDQDSTPETIQQTEWWSAAQKNIRDREYHITHQKKSILPDTGEAHQTPNRAQNLRTNFTSKGIKGINRTANDPLGHVEPFLKGMGRETEVTPVPTNESPMTKGSHIEFHTGDVVEGYENRPDGLASTIARALKDDLPAAYHMKQSANTYRAQNDAHHMRFTFSPLGLLIQNDDASWEWEIVLTHWGRGAELEKVPNASPVAKGGFLSYQRGPDLTEWYLNTSWGLEQGFTLNRRPSTSSEEYAPVILQLSLASNLNPQLIEYTTNKPSEQTLLMLDAKGEAAVNYSGLRVNDAHGKILPAHFSLVGNNLSISIDDRSASYPITVDPWVQQAKLTANDGSAGDYFGRYLAVSGDTAVVGAYGDDSYKGSAYIFIKPPSGWMSTSTYSAKLIASDGAVNDYLGQKVAIDGDTVVVSAHGDDIYKGSVYVFERPLSGWSGTLTESAKLTLSGSEFYDYFGASIAISGNSVVVGAWGVDCKVADCGAAYVFEKPITGWTTTSSYDAKLIGSNTTGDDWFGISVAIDGDDVAVGASRHDFELNSNRGVAYIFEKPVGGWSGTLFESAKLAATDGTLNDNLGVSVAIDADNVVVGATGYYSYSGGAYVFKKPGGGWSGTIWESAKLTAADAAADDWFGFAADIESSTVLIGAYLDDCGPANCGSAYVFEEPGNGWSGSLTEITKLVASDGEMDDKFGCSVALNGDIALIGAYGDASNKGSAYIFVFDDTPPNSPVVSCPDCNGRFSSSKSPTWNWSSGGSGGSGIFRFRRDNPDLSSQPETSEQSYTPSEVLSEGEGIEHILFVQERDIAGNWSASGSFTIEIDSGEPCSTASSVNVVDDLSKTFVISYEHGDSYDGEPCSISNGTSGSGIEKVDLYVKAPGEDDYTLVDTDAEGVGSGLDGQFSYTATDEGAYDFYTIATDDAGNEELETESDTQTIYSSHLSGYAIVAVGAIAGNPPEGIQSHTLTANNVYKHLINRNFALVDNPLERWSDPLDHIKYFNPYSEDQIGEDDYTEGSTLSYLEAMQKAITQWALDKMTALPGPLYITLIDHGIEDIFYLQGFSVLTPQNLDDWLTVLEDGLALEGIEEDIVIILGSCYSASFIDELSKPGRIIVAASAADEPSYRGPEEPVFGIRDGEFFTTSLFNELGKGNSLKQSFLSAVERIEIHTDSGYGMNGYPYFDNARQHPFLDDDGMLPGSHALEPGDDGDRSETIFLGHANSAVEPVEIIDVIGYPDTIITTSSLLVWATVSNIDATDRVWVEIREPGTTLEGGTEQQLVDLIEVPLILNTDRYEATLPVFSQIGQYTLFFYARDDDGFISHFKKSYVYKESAINSPPDDFSLIYPENNADVAISFMLDWQDTQDIVDGDPITYLVTISTNPDLTIAAEWVYRQEGIQHSTLHIDETDGIQNMMRYYWQVIAIDAYGATTETTIWSFTTDSVTNFPAGIIDGFVYDIDTNAYINNATITVGSQSFISALDGHYIGLLIPGTYGISIAAPGYGTVNSGQVTMTEAGRLTRNFGLTAAGTGLTATIDAPASAVIIAQGQSVNFQGSANGGTAPYTYAWDFDGGATNSTDEDPGNVTFDAADVYSVTLTVIDNGMISDYDTVTIMVEDPSTDTDNDGTPDVSDMDDDNDGQPDTEERGPKGDEPAYDGNSDNIIDSLQDNAASLHTFDQQNYVTLETPVGITIINCQAVDNPSPSDTPNDLVFPMDFFEFTLEGPGHGFATTVTLYLAAGSTYDTYYKYGQTTVKHIDHWYEFLFDGTTGAEINTNVITLHFQDGQKGDDDLVEDGFIIDVGGPAKAAQDNGDGTSGTSSSGGGGGGGCFVDTLANESAFIIAAVPIIFSVIIMMGVFLKNKK